jgi:hypothetical protein
MQLDPFSMPSIVDSLLHAKYGYSDDEPNICFFAIVSDPINDNLKSLPSLSLSALSLVEQVPTKMANLHRL